MEIHILSLHKTQSVICLSLIFPRTCVRVFSEIIEFQTPVKKKSVLKRRVQILPAVLTMKGIQVDTLYHDSCAYGDTHSTTP